MPYRWTINGKTFPDSKPLPVAHGERVRLRFTNRSAMFHPMHVHGDTFALPGGGARKDTVIVKPNQTVTVELDATNPGQMDDPLPQHLPRRTRDDDQHVVPGVTAWPTDR